MPRFAVQILYFDCDQFILRTIANCAPFVEKIFVTYSPEPWSAYNKEARNLYKNPSNPQTLKQSPHYDKIQLIEGIWDTEEDQRNHCLDVAKDQGFDYLIIQDADEFYLKEEYQKNIDGILANPDYDYYRNPWYYFWKDLNHVIVSRYSKRNGTAKPYKKTMLSYCPNFAMNLNKNILFKNKRQPSSKEYLLLDGLCYHLSYVLGEDQLKRKLKTWGHSGDFNVNRWYKTKWLAWTEGKKNLHPIEPTQWYKAKRIEISLPDELKCLKIGKQDYLELGIFEVLREKVFDTKALLMTLLRDAKHIFQN